MTEPIPFAQLLEEYATVADYIDAKEAEIAGIKKIRDKIKVALQAAMNSLDINTAKSTKGHRVDKVHNNACKVTDAEAFYDFVFETGDTSFLTKHVAADAVKEYLDREQKLPPGVELTSSVTLRFTKA